MSRAAERRDRRRTRFWVLLGTLASLFAGLLLATMAAIVVLLLTPGNARDNIPYCSASGVGAGETAGVGETIEYREEGWGGFPPGDRCDIYLVDSFGPVSSPERLLAHHSYPGAEEWFWVILCLLAPPALWAVLVAVSEAGATRSRR